MRAWGPHRAPRTPDDPTRGYDPPALLAQGHLGSLPEEILSGFNSDDGMRRAVQKVLDEFVKAESPIFRKTDAGYILFGQPS